MSSRREGVGFDFVGEVCDLSGILPIGGWAAQPYVMAVVPMWHRVVSLSRGATTPKEEKASYEIKTIRNISVLPEQRASRRHCLGTKSAKHTAGRDRHTARGHQHTTQHSHGTG